MAKCEHIPAEPVPEKFVLTLDRAEAELVLLLLGALAGSINAQGLYSELRRFISPTGKRLEAQVEAAGAVVGSVATGEVLLLRVASR